MKKLIFILTMTVAFAHANPIKSDTTIVEFSDKESNNKVKVITSKKTIELPKSLNLNNVLKAIGVDSSERDRAIVLVSKRKGANDTLLVLSREGQKIKIITKQMPVDTTVRPKVKIKTDDNGEEEIETFEKTDEEVEIEDKEEKDNNYERKPEKSKKFFSRSDFAIYLGINGFRNTPASNPFLQLRTWTSRYAALSFRKNATLIRGKAADLAFSYGPEIAWYNFMFENSNVARYDKTKAQVSFVENTKPTSKSKLVVPYINLPFMFNIGFKEDKFKIGFGGYIGYRVGGYTKEKFASEGKLKTQGNYGLSNNIYGLTAEIGKKGGLTLYGRYDLNNLFKSDQTILKDLQAFSLGVRL